MKLIFFAIISVIPVLSQGQDVKDFKQVKDRIDVTLSEGTLSICPLTDNAVRIKFFKDADVRMPELVFTSDVRTPKFTVSNLPSRLEMRTRNMVVVLHKQDGSLFFANSSGKVFLREKAGHPEVST